MVKADRAIPCAMGANPPQAPINQAHSVRVGDPSRMECPIHQATVLPLP